MAERALARRIGAAPRISSSEAVRAAEWLRSIAETAAGTSLAEIVADFPIVAALIEGIATASPYLWDLLCADPARFAALLAAEPKAHLQLLQSRLAEAVAICTDEATAMCLLRRFKAETALLIALTDIGEVWE